MEGINQNFEGVKNDVFVERERERDCFYLFDSKPKASNLNFFQFANKYGESAVVFAAGFLFSKFMTSDPGIRLPYKDDDDDSPHPVNPEEKESLDNEVDASEE